MFIIKKVQHIFHQRITLTGAIDGFKWETCDKSTMSGKLSYDSCRNVVFRISHCHASGVGVGSYQRIRRFYGIKFVV